jgi:hypothetical protein
LNEYTKRDVNLFCLLMAGITAMQQAETMPNN